MNKLIQVLSGDLGPKTTERRLTISGSKCIFAGHGSESASGVFLGFRCERLNSLQLLHNTVFRDF